MLLAAGQANRSRKVLTLEVPSQLSTTHLPKLRGHSSAKLPCLDRRVGDASAVEPCVALHVRVGVVVRLREPGIGGPPRGLWAFSTGKNHSKKHDPKGFWVIFKWFLPVTGKPVFLWFLHQLAASVF